MTRLFQGVQGDPVGPEFLREPREIGHGCTEVIEVPDGFGAIDYVLVCDRHQWAGHRVASRALLDGDVCAKCAAESDGGDARYKELHRALSVAGHRAA